nr:hypothetical transcript [Hymenolepis microstoma]
MMPSYGTIDDIEPTDEAQVEFEINDGQEDIQVEFLRKNTSTESALFNFLKGNIGTGILALPIAFKHAGLWLGFALLLFYAILSTYVMHQLLRITEETLPIRNRMREPDRFVSTFGVLNVTMVITTCLCTTIGFFGYLRFGDDILGSITYNIPNTPVIYSLVKPLFIFTIFLTYLLQFYVPALIFARLMKKIPCHRAATLQKQSLHRKLMRADAIAMLVPHLDLMVSLLGAISSSVLAILAPPILEIIHYWPEREQIPWFYAKIAAKNVFIISVGVFSAVFGTAATVLEIARVMRQ